MFKKIENLLQKLSSEPNVGGLRVTNGSVQYVLRTGKKKKNVSVERLGMLEEALVKLHSQISAKKEEVVKVVVSLPADVVYTQSFKVPYMREEEMEESANLNLQMITPIEAKNAFMDWQNIRETENQKELLGAFVEKKNVEEIQKALESANFYAATFEFPALGISRLVAIEKEESGEPSSKLILEISSDGMDFFIVKNGAMYFDYFVSWKEMQSEGKEIPKEVFEERLGKEVRRVLNFAEGKTGGSISSILYIATGMEKRVEELIRQNFGGNVAPLVIKNEELDGSWYAAAGSALRGNPRRAFGVNGKSSGKREINLGTESLEKVLFEERLLRFVKLWRNIGITVLTVFLVLDGAFASLVTTQARKLSEGMSGFKTRASEAELEKLEKKAREFNALVGAVESTRVGDRNWYAFLANLKNLARGENITITRMEVDAKGSAVTLGAEGESHGAVIEFKNKLAEEPSLENVDLPLGRIAVTENGKVSFSLSFKIRGGREDGQ